MRTFDRLVDRIPGTQLGTLIRARHFNELQESIEDIQAGDLDIAGLTLLQGRGVLALYDDFSAYANGSPSGEETAIGGFTWVTSGSQPPTVTSGKLSSTGSGYLYTTLDATPIVVEAEVSFGGTGNDTACCTIAICKTAGGTIIDNIAHLIFGPTGANLQLNKDGSGSFDFILDAAWPEVPKDGTKARVRLMIRGDRATIFGPDGSAWSTRDRRIGDTLGTAYQTVFWQATTAGATDAYLHTVSVFGDTTTGSTALADRVTSAPFEMSISPDQTIFSRGKPWQVKLGTGASDSNPSIHFGLAAGEMRALLLADANSGATSIQCDVPMHGFSSIVVGYGDQAETVTASGTSGSTAPYTITVSALSKDHTANEPITNVSASTTKVYFDVGQGMLIIPSGVMTAGILELGANRDTAIGRGASGTVVSTTPGPNTSVLRTASGATGDRPTAATVGAGAEYFDTTIGKPIWSTGAAWVLADGTSA